MNSAPPPHHHKTVNQNKFRDGWKRIFSLGRNKGKKSNDVTETEDVILQLEEPDTQVEVGKEGGSSSSTVVENLNDMDVNAAKEVVKKLEEAAEKRIRFLEQMKQALSDD
ncbi:hypothetical protein HDU79_004325 [Rhizoclosmatium sp. JEL0117]|nr:hypothetical protein HDU79_004325 [Rhizoclosmatium sp. JEL0117]